MIVATLILNITGYADTQTSVLPYIPQKHTGVLKGDYYTLNYTLVNEPFIDKKTSILLLYIYKAQPNTGPMQLEIVVDVGNNSVLGVNPGRIDKVVNPPVSYGYTRINLTIKTQNQPDKVNITLNITLTPLTNQNNNSKQASIPITIGSLSTEGSVPTPIVYGAITSLLASILLPTTLFLWNRGRKKLTITFSLIIIFTIILTFWSFHTYNTESNNIVLRYLWQQGKTGGITYIYKTGSTYKGITLAISNTISLKNHTKCPQPFCTNGNGLTGTGYYYHNALRDAMLLENSTTIGFYSKNGILFFLYKRQPNTTIVLNASHGFNPPIEKNYYLKLFLAPPVISAILSIGALAWSRRRR